MFKIALNAGHYIGTAGKRCDKALDPNQTREWWLNDRICDKIESKLKAYTGYELLRMDDTTGKKDVYVLTRTDKANEWGADFYLSIHHNAGINGGTGGGIVAFKHRQASKEAGEWQVELYNAIIKHTGLKGNRADPMPEKNFDELHHTKMPAVLLECGFMDSKTDVPIILTDKFAEQVADACVEVIVKRGGLTKKAVEPTTSAKLYRVQVGAYSKKANAEKMQAKLKAEGYDAIIV